MRSRTSLVLIAAVCSAIMAIAVVLWVDRLTPVTISITSVEPQPIQVSVTGAVASPGVVTLPAGSRLQHVLDAAGGLTADADVSSINLAGRVGDGEAIEVPYITVHAEGDTDQRDVTGLIDINRASADELTALPGIGEVIAGRIVAYREEQGPFTSVDELDHIDGISFRLVEKLRPLVTVGAGE